MRLALVKFIITPVFHLIKEDEVVEESTGTPVVMYPQKLIPLYDLKVKLEVEVNKDKEGMQKLVDRPLF